MDPSSMAKSGRAAVHWDSKAVREGAARKEGMFTWPGLEVREAKRAAWPTRPVKLSSASREVIFVSVCKHLVAAREDNSGRVIFPSAPHSPSQAGWVALTVPGAIG